MSRTATVREEWHPQTVEDRQEVLLELQAILASPHFCNSRRYPALLRYVVERTLDGKADLLKERTLGVEVFARSPSYDTGADTVVRYTAGEVRKRLSLYYHDLDHKPSIHIALPAGSYIPEFLHTAHIPQHVSDPQHAADIDVASSRLPPDSSLDLIHRPADLPPAGRGHQGDDALAPQTLVAFAPPKAARRPHWRAFALLLLVALIASAWQYRHIHAGTPMDDFWSPLLHNQPNVLVCSGGVIFKEGNFSGVITAGRDIDYPFISGQIASALTHISGVIERRGATIDLQFSASTPLSALRNQPVILLGGYNNQWSMRLLDPLPIHFQREPGNAIVDTTQPGVRWERDHSQPYSATDDYAIIARFRDTTTDSWVLVLAGIGRNGTEAAAQMVTSPRYLQMLKDRLGTDFATNDIEAVLRVKVIDGKTAAPTILAVKSWHP